MPFRIDHTATGWRLYNITNKAYAKRTFKTREAAVSAGRGYIRFRERKSAVLRGNRLLPRDGG